MQLIDNPLLTSLRSPVILEAGRIGFSQIHHHASAPVAVAANGVRIRSAYSLPICPHQIVVVHAMEVLRKFQLPHALLLCLHFLYKKGFIRNSVSV